MRRGHYGRSTGTPHRHHRKSGLSPRKICALWLQSDRRPQGLSEGGDGKPRSCSHSTQQNIFRSVLNKLWAPKIQKPTEQPRHAKLPPATCTAHALLTSQRQAAAPPSFCMLEPNIGELIFRLIHCAQTTENILPSSLLIFLKFKLHISTESSRVAIIIVNVVDHD